MESLAANEIIKNSQILYDFLTIEKEQDFVARKKEYQKIKAPVKLSEIKSMDGEVNYLYYITFKKIIRGGVGIKFQKNINYHRKF